MAECMELVCEKTGVQVCVSTHGNILAGYSMWKIAGGCVQIPMLVHSGRACGSNWGQGWVCVTWIDWSHKAYVSMADGMTHVPGVGTPGPLGAEEGHRRPEPGGGFKLHPT